MQEPWLWTPFWVHAGEGVMPMQIVQQKSLYFSWSVKSLFKEDISHPSSQFSLKPRGRDGRAAWEEGRQPRGQPECIETTTNSYPTASLLPSHRGTWQKAQAQMRVSMGTITMKIQDKDGPDQHTNRTAKNSKRSPGQRRLDLSLLQQENQQETK